MNIIQIVEQHLTSNGFDGLCGDECGCKIGDIAPCGHLLTDCFPGYEVPVPEGDDYSFFMSIHKP